MSDDQEVNLGFWWDYRRLSRINVGYAGLIFCHECACEYGARDFSANRGWCYVCGDSEAVPKGKVQLYVESLCDTSNDSLIDEMAELFDWSGDVMEAEDDEKGLRVRFDVTELEEKEWAALYADIPKGCIDTSESGCIHTAEDCDGT